MPNIIIRRRAITQSTTPLVLPPISGYSLWFRVNGLLPGVTNSYGVADSSPNISKLSSVTGESPYAEQTTLLNQPTLVYSVLGTSLKKSARFTGSPVSMSLLNSSALAQNTGAVTLYFVAKVTTGGASRVLFYLSTSSAANARFVVNSSAADVWSLSTRRADAEGATTLTGGSSLTTKIVAVVMDYTNNNSFIYENGALVNSSSAHGSVGSTSNTASAETSLCKNSAGNHFIGDVGDVLFYKGSAHSSTQVSQMSDWLNAFYRIY